ncbi:MAG: TonB-dependent receptor [Bacteroidota bacterium]
MKQNLILFLLCILSCAARTQTLRVIDNTTREPLYGALVYSRQPQLNGSTNQKGEVNISPFQAADSIYISFIGYTTVVFTYKQLESAGFVVELTESISSIGGITIIASRWKEKKVENPYKIETLDMKEVAFQNPQTAADLLGTSGYVYIQKSQLAGGSPMIRGFATNRVILVVDGVRMNNAIFRAGNVQNVISLDASGLDGAEILFGPGAIMYGSDAIGGVMSFKTLEPVFSDTDTTLFKGSGLVRYSGANYEKTGHMDLRIGLRKLAFATAFTYSDYDDLRAGSHGNSYFLRPVYQDTINGTDTVITNPEPSLQVHSGYSQTNFMQKIAFMTDSGFSAEYGFHYSVTSNAPRYDRLTLDANNDSVPDNAVWYYGPQKWMMNRLRIIVIKERRMFSQLRLVAAMQNYQESRHDRKFGSSSQRNQTETVDAWSLNLDLDKKLSDRLSLFYGMEGVYNKVGSVANRVHIATGEVTPTTTRYPNGSTWQSYGVYGTVKYRLAERWILNSGLRYSHTLIEADFDTTFFPFPFTHAQNSNGALNGGIGFVFNPDQSWQLYLNGSTGFRAPNIDDIGKVFESEPGSVVVPNPGLKPEYAYNFEIGTVKAFGNFLRLDLALYYTYLDNALARRNFTYNGQDSILYDGNMSQVQAIQNIAKAYVYGLQAGLELALGKGLMLKSVISYQYGEEQSDDSLVYYPKSHLAPLFGNTHLTYQRRMLKLDLYADYNAGMDYEDLALSERNDDAPYARDANGRPFVPGWYTLNFKMGLYVSRYLSLNAGIENISDRLYRPYASGISAPGRNFIISMKGSF